MKRVLITGGAGFVGSNLAVFLKEKYPRWKISCFDNLKRRGSELNLKRLKQRNITFIHGDVRQYQDLGGLKELDIILECSAEPSVLGGISSSPDYIIGTNLLGAANCLELARTNRAAFIFISTSRVYPFDRINSLNIKEVPSRFVLQRKQSMKGASDKGISEEFPLQGIRSLYGATKLSGELLFKEYMYLYGIKGVINRCGVISGPYQMGRVDQGVLALWMAYHVFKKELFYIGFGGKGQQVRDFLHIKDLFDLIDLQLQNLGRVNGKIYNVGGGIGNSMSLKEFTSLCEEITGNKVKVGSFKKERYADVKLYVSDCSRVQRELKWKPRSDVRKIANDVFQWILNDRENLKHIWI